MGVPGWVYWPGARVNDEGSRSSVKVAKTPPMVEKPSDWLIVATALASCSTPASLLAEMVGSAVVVASIDTRSPVAVVVSALA